MSALLLCAAWGLVVGFGGGVLFRDVQAINAELRSRVNRV